MQLRIELPNAAFTTVASLAAERGETPAEWLQHLVMRHLDEQRRVTPPLFLASETGPIRSLTNAEIDTILDRDEHPDLFRDESVAP